MPDTALIGIASGNFPLIDIDLTVAIQLGIFLIVLVVWISYSIAGIL